MKIDGSKTMTTRNWQQSMKIIKIILLCFYGVQALLIVPMFLRGIYRHEQSLWVWEEFFYELTRQGLGNAILTVYLYVIFYLFPFFGTFFLLRLILIKLNRYVPNSIILFISTWGMATFIFFLPSCCEFIRNIPNLWNGFIFWCISTFLVVLIFWRFMKENKDLFIEK